MIDPAMDGFILKRAEDLQVKMEDLWESQAEELRAIANMDV